MLDEHLVDGTAVLLDLADDPELRAIASGHADRVRVLTATCPDEAALTGCWSGRTGTWRGPARTAPSPGWTVR